MKLLVINGPNLNMLGIREPGIYGSESYAALEAFIRRVCDEHGAEVEIFQSNHEGAIVDRIQAAWGNTDGIVIIPAVEVHLSDVSAREPFRHISYAGMACETTFAGYGFDGYRMAVEYLLRRLG